MSLPRPTGPRFALIILFLFTRHAVAVAPSLTGAGSTFVYPVMAKWAAAYARETGVEVNYQSIGSGGGLKEIRNQTVDFGATDVPLDRAALGRDELTEFPLVAGAIVPAVHLEGVADQTLKLSGPTLAAIFLGEIRRWNDPRLRVLNPDLALPDRLITVIHRADGSGTTHVFTTYLSRVSATWRTRVGTATAVTWPAGVGAKGNEGVAAFVKLTNGSIGYVEAAFAARAHLTSARLVNRDGHAVAPTPKNISAALHAAVAATGPGAGAETFPSLVDPPGPQSWPINGATFILLRQKPNDAVSHRAALAFFRWAFEHGGPAAESLHYVALPEKVRRMIVRGWPASGAAP